MKMSGHQNLPEEKRRDLEQFQVNLVGAEHEDEIFEKTRSLLKKLNVQNTTVFNGFKIEATKTDIVEKEFDFLIISGNSKLIVHMEAKSSNNEVGTQRKRATKQLDKSSHYFKLHQIPKAENWKIVRCMTFQTNSEEVCATCKDFVLTLDDLNQDWWENLTRLAQNFDQTTVNDTGKINLIYP